MKSNEIHVITERSQIGIDYKMHEGQAQMTGKLSREKSLAIFIL